MLLIALFAQPCLARFECAELVEQKHADVGDLRHERGLLWKVTRSNSAPNYLFGTIHIGDPRVTDLPPAITEALLSSESFTMEVLMDLGTLLEMAQEMYYQDGTKLSAVVGDELFARVVERLGGYGIPAEAAAVLKPWAAYTTLSLPPGQTALPQDMLLMLTAQQAGKSLRGLESLQEQAAVFESLSSEDQVAMLAELVCHYDLMQRDVELMIEHYIARDLKALMQMTVRYRSTHQDHLLEALLKQRNPRMLERMLPSLKEGKAFIAVGALHLPGKGGLLHLLEENGFRVEAVY
jgi:uncharacterized protein YbaP (TraB family)